MKSIEKLPADRFDIRCYCDCGHQARLPTETMPPDMTIDVGAGVQLAARDTVVVASDGVTDNVHFDEIIGQSEPLLRTLDDVRQVATTDSTVLILGETGTGKELVAHEVHAQSGRSGQAFITVDLGTVPSTLLDSELFGHAAAHQFNQPHHIGRGGSAAGDDEVGVAFVNLGLAEPRAL